MNPGLLSIVILAHNLAAISGLCLRSLLQATYRPLEVLFINNGSTDGTRRLLRQFAGQARTAGLLFRPIHLERNEGCIHPRNQAMAMCRGEWIALMDNDVILRNRSVFERLVGLLAAHPQVGVVAPKFVYAAPPYRIQSAGGGVTREGICFLLGRGAERDCPEFNQVAVLPWVLSACMVMARPLVEELGGLDAAFHPVGFEDVDYCFRVRAAGRTVVYLPGVEVYHVENTTTGNRRLWDTRAVARRNQLLFRRKWKHMLPPEPRVVDLSRLHLAEPRVPIWELDRVPLLP